MSLERLRARIELWRDEANRDRQLYGIEHNDAARLLWARAEYAAYCRVLAELSAGVDLGGVRPTNSGRPVKVEPKAVRYCGMCDRWVSAKQTTCKACGADTYKAEK